MDDFVTKFKLNPCPLNKTKTEKGDDISDQKGDLNMKPNEAMLGKEDTRQEKGVQEVESNASKSEMITEN